MNPDTVEAGALVRYAQLADFSSLARLDQCRTHGENLVLASEALVPVLLYGFLTKLDLDSDDAVSLRCGRCSGPMTLGNGGEVLHQIHVKNINWDELEGTTASTYKLFSGVLFI